MAARKRSQERRRQGKARGPSGPPRSGGGLIGFRRAGVWAGGLGLLAVHFALAVTSVKDKCCTFDEVAHLTKGYAWWRFDDHRLMPEHPPLAQAWAALPLLDDGLTFPRRDRESWYGSDTYKLGKEFFYRLGNDPDRMLRQSRRMIALLSTALGGLVFFWSRRLFGNGGGFISLVLYAFSPTMLAHGRLVTTDLAVSLFFLASVGGLWWVLHKIGPATLLLGAGALAGLFLSKMSSLLIIPVGLALVVVRLVGGGPLAVRWGRPRRVTARWHMGLIFLPLLVFFVLAVWGAIWAGYDFRYEAMLEAQPGRDRFFTPKPVPPGKTVWEYQSRGVPTAAAVVEWMRARRVLPESYLHGFLFTMQSTRGRDAFLDGERRLTGWRTFFPRCFLYKVPLAVMGLVVLAAAAPLSGRSVILPAVRADRPGAVSRSQGDRWSGLYRTAPLWMLMVVYWAAAISSHLNIGHRHLLPTFAPMFVLCGAAGAWLRAPRKWVRPVVPVLLAALVVVSLRAWPHYLAFFNSLAGGPSNGYRHLVDSSLDWGQDLPGLRRWLDKNRGPEKVYVAYFGTGDWKHYRIKAYPLPYYLRSSGTGTYRLEAGIYCISATRLQQVYLLKTARWTEDLEAEYRRLLPEMRQFEQTPNSKEARAALLQRKDKGFKSRFDRFARLRFGRLCAYLRSGEPDHQVGHSILIYRVSKAQLAAALEGPPPTGDR